MAEDITNRASGTETKSEPEAVEEQLRGICPHCGAVRQGLAFDFFENVMTVSGRVCTVAYFACSCAKCGKMITVGIIGMAEANVQPQNFRTLRRM